MRATFDLWKCDQELQGYPWDISATLQTPPPDPLEARFPFRGTAMEELDHKEVHMLRFDVDLTEFAALIMNAKAEEELEDLVEQCLSYLTMTTGPLPDSNSQGCWQQYRLDLVIFGDEGNERCEVFDATKTAPLDIHWQGPLYCPDEPGEVLEFLAEEGDTALLNNMICTLALAGYKKTKEAGLR